MPPLSSKRPGRPSDPQRRAQRRAQLVEAAAAVFAQRGYEQTDLELVAQRAGIAKATIYLYFQSKQELFLAAVDAGMRNLVASTTAVRLASSDPLDAIAGAIRAYLEFFDAHPHLVELLIQERAQFKDRKKPTYFEMREANSAPWRQLIEELIAAGRVRDVPVDRVMDVMGELVYGAMFTNYFAGRTRSVEAQSRDLLDIVFHGILSDQERRRRLEPGKKK